jgi:hypothetical protein
MIKTVYFIGGVVSLLFCGVRRREEKLKELNTFF